jgi:hypothetical protein
MRTEDQLNQLENQLETLQEVTEKIERFWETEIDPVDESAWKAVDALNASIDAHNKAIREIKENWR